MIEARIECLCVGGYHLADLETTLQQGAVLWVSESRARGSADLRLAERARAVAVRWEERCAVSRQPVPARRPPLRLQPQSEQPPRLKRAVAAPPTPEVKPPTPVIEEAAPNPPVVETLNVVRRTRKKDT